jgi:hypothetical protein
MTEYKKMSENIAKDTVLKTKTLELRQCNSHGFWPLTLLGIGKVRSSMTVTGIPSMVYRWMTMMKILIHLVN